MISVIIPLYNKEKEIAYALKSVLNQTYTDFEIIVVNDGSTDGSENVVRSFKDSRVRLISQRNAGVSAARNRGIAEAKGEYIALLDSDDGWLSNCLDTFMTLAKTFKDCDVFAVGYQFCNENGQISNTIIRNLPFSTEIGRLSNYFVVAYSSHPPIWTSAVMFTKKSIMSIGCFPVGVKSGEDLLTWARLACKFKIAYSKKICATYNIIENYNKTNVKRRPHDSVDNVGYELEKLLSEHPKVRGLRRYVGHWHKMRASVYLRSGDTKNALFAALKSLKFYPLNCKVFVFIALSCLPKVIREKIFNL